MIFFILCVTFVVIFVSKIYAIVVDDMYPSVDCDYIEEVYNGTYPLEYWAYSEYVNYYNTTGDEESIPL